MNFEIERKFLVRGHEWLRISTRHINIRQAYLSCEGEASVRVRIQDDSRAWLTIKSRPADVQRLELEYPIPIDHAEALLELRHGLEIRKVRHIVPWQGLTWEVDVFAAENTGLTIAEVELHHAHQHFEMPAWIDAEITGQSKYYNSYLAQKPFCTWHEATVPSREFT